MYAYSIYFKRDILVFLIPRPTIELDTKSRVNCEFDNWITKLLAKCAGATRIGEEHCLPVE